MFRGTRSFINVFTKAICSHNYADLNVWGKIQRISMMKQAVYITTVLEVFMQTASETRSLAV